MSGVVEDFYEGFSRDVGLSDWAVPNPRHEQLRLVLERVLGGRSGLRILDVGCGAGVMSGHLTRYGAVEGVDLSGGAIALAGTLVPDGRFHAGRLEQLGLPGPYDLVTLFDVLEHVPHEDRHSFLSGLTERLADGGVLLASAPHGDFTRWLLSARPDLAQAIEVEVQFPELLHQLAARGLRLLHYEVYEIDFAWQYQAMAFVRPAVQAGGPPRVPASLRRRLRARANPVATVARRARPAARLARAEGLRSGVRLLVGDVPSARPLEHR